MSSWLPFLRKKNNIPLGTDERTSLLPKPTDHDNGSGSVFSEFALLLKSSIPVILAYTLQNSLQTVSVLIVGRLSPEHLATAAFSYMFAMSTAWLIALGGTTALDTLCSSSFTGSKNPHELGIFDIPPGLNETCGSYAANFLETATGYLTNPSATSECGYCPYSVADEYLRAMDIPLGGKWKYFGAFGAMTITNWMLLYFFVYTVRIRGWTFGMVPLFRWIGFGINFPMWVAGKVMRKDRKSVV